MSYASLPEPIRQTAEQHLTPKQLRILQDRLNGNSWRTIAHRNHMHEATARGHYKAAIQKLADLLTEAA